MNKLKWLLFGDDEKENKQTKQIAKYARIAGFVFLSFVCLFVLSYIFSFLRYILGFGVLAGAGYGAWLLSKPWRQGLRKSQTVSEEGAEGGEEKAPPKKVDDKTVDRLYAKYGNEEGAPPAEPAEKTAPKMASNAAEREQSAREQLAAMKRERSK